MTTDAGGPYGLMRADHIGSFVRPPALLDLQARLDTGQASR